MPSIMSYLEFLVGLASSMCDMIKQDHVYIRLERQTTVHQEARTHHGYNFLQLLIAAGKKDASSESTTI